jgi:carbamoyltransferase
MVILGINSAYHEPAAALLVDGQLVAACEEERFNRTKHGKQARPHNADQLPWRSIDFCLCSANLGYNDVSSIGVSLDPWARRRARWCDQRSAVPGDFGTDDGEEIFLHAQLRARAALLERMRNANFYFLPHHLCHAASAYHVSPHSDAAILIVDGIGEFASAWAGLGSRNSIRPLFQVEYPHSLGFLWEKTCEFLGFDRYDGPGKVMALGAASSPKSSRTGIDYRERFDSFVRTRPGVSFEVDPEVLQYRTPGFEDLETRLGSRGNILADMAERSAIAASLQEKTEQVLVHLATELWNSVNRGGNRDIEALCLAGGVSLNCVANARIALSTPWKQIWIQPAANDAGTALGAALLIWHDVLGRTERVPFSDIFLGPAYSDSECRAAISAAGFSCRTVSDISLEVARLVARGKVVGWFQGRMEFGPRALGNRSILADPRNPKIPSVLNGRIKERERFRPFAPTVQAEEVHRYFATADKANGRSHDPLEYMLVAVPARAKATAGLAGVVHRNEYSGRASSRVHSLVAGRNQAYEELLAACRQELGVPAILNTSFNVQEPIVCSPEDACKTFARSRLDSLILGRYIVERN